MPWVRVWTIRLQEARYGITMTACAFLSATQISWSPCLAFGWLDCGRLLRTLPVLCIRQRCARVLRFIAPERLRGFGTRASTAPIPVRICRSGRWPLRATRRRRPGNFSSSKADRDSSNSAETAASIRRGAPARSSSASGSETAAGGAREPHYRCSGAVCSSCRDRDSRLDFSRDTPHDPTHPYATFDHSFGSIPGGSRREEHWANAVSG